jgi:hypothetical protein
MATIEQPRTVDSNQGGQTEKSQGGQAEESGNTFINELNVEEKERMEVGSSQMLLVNEEAYVDGELVVEGKVKVL